MSVFKILFEPDLPVAPLNASPITGDINWHRVLSIIPTEFNLVYWIGGTVVTYYPSELIAIFEDIRRELPLVQNRVRHAVLISGYPVLDVEYEGAWARFFHADELNLQGRSPIHGPIAAQEVERVVGHALRRVWSVVRAAERAAP